MSTGFLVQEKKRKINFQDGRHNGHRGFPIGTILLIVDLQVTPMLYTKFRVNWPRGVGGVGFNLKQTVDGARRSRDDGRRILTDHNISTLSTLCAGELKRAEIEPLRNTSFYTIPVGLESR